MTAAVFADRVQAGRELGDAIRALPLDGATGTGDPVVLGLPRGGVVVAREVAAALEVPVGFLGVRKIASPAHPELAVGAIAEGGAQYRDDALCRMVGVAPREWDELVRAARRELDRRVRLYREGRPEPDLLGRTVVLVDDGIATGATARAACRAVRARGARVVVVAVPVAPADWHDGPLAREADRLVAVEEPADLGAVGRFYRDFAQVDDAGVRAALARR